MCNIGIMLETAGVQMPTVVLFMNSNKSERNIRKKVAKTREKCLSHGIILGHDVIINKGPDRDIDHDAINMLISLLLDGKYELVVVDKLTDLTTDLSNLEEVLKDAAAIGIGVFELSTMQVRSHVYLESGKDCGYLADLIRMWS